MNASSTEDKGCVQTPGVRGCDVGNGRTVKKSTAKGIDRVEDDKGWMAGNVCMAACLSQLYDKAAMRKIGRHSALSRYDDSR